MNELSQKVLEKGFLKKFKSERTANFEFEIGHNSVLIATFVIWIAAFWWQKYQKPISEQILLLKNRAFVWDLVVNIQACSYGGS